MRRRVMSQLGEPHQIELGDIWLYNISNGKKFFVKPADYSTTTYPTSNYTPIGVCAIPSSLGLYGDEYTAGIISINILDCSSPDTGKHSLLITDIAKMWYGYIDTKLGNYNIYPFYGDSDISDVSFDQVLSANYMFLSGITNYWLNAPSSSLGSSNGILSPDGIAYYDKYCGGSSAALRDAIIPSAYASDGVSINLDFLLSSSYSITQAISGKEFTEYLQSLATSLSNWRTASTITDSNEEGYYPAACCAYRFHTAGTNLGDWYLPSFVEANLIMNRSEVIRLALYKTYGKTSSLNWGILYLLCSTPLVYNNQSSYIYTQLPPLDTLIPFLVINPNIQTYESNGTTHTNLAPTNVITQVVDIH